jgi:type I restriction enzyme S subunit
MGSEWTEILLKDACSKIGSGATPRGGNSVYLSQGYFALIRSQNVRNDSFHHNGLVFIEKQHADKLSNVSVEKGDVLLNITGDSVARCCQVDPSILPARVNQHVAIIRPISTILDAQFLRYYFVSPAMQNEMLSMAGIGATRNALTKGMIESFEIPLPPLPEQKAIAHILGSLDDKIELNRRMNETLEGMAQALFKSWFTDFDPVIDNILIRNMGRNQPSPPPLPGGEELLKPSLPSLPTGEKPSFDVEQSLPLWERLGEGAIFDAAESPRSLGEDLGEGAIFDAAESPRPLGEDLGEGAIFDGIPEEFAVRAETRRKALADGTANREAAKAFPAAFQETEEMGWIPEGWAAGKMSDHAFVQMGQSPKGDTYNSDGEGTPLVNGPVEFGPYFTNKSKWTTSPTKLSRKGDLIVCVRGSTTGRFVKSDDRYCLGRGVCSVRGMRSQCFVDQIFKSSITEMLGLTTGSTFPNWSRQTLAGFEVIVPPEFIVDKFDELIAPNIERIESGVVESESLGKLRDTLLPKLISGELRIEDAEKMVGEYD